MMTAEMLDVQQPFRLAMRRMAATVCIVTTRDAGIAYGMTATSVTALSMDPPSLMVAINQAASIHEPLLKVGAFWINLLRDDHDNECAVFSGKVKGPDRFQSGAWLDRHDIPRLLDAQANIYCRIAKTIPFATHTIVIGSVAEAVSGEEVNPLIFLNGKARTSVSLGRVAD
jgi:flavin reductase (DIM6/NTAB) family NADH-FMN oxidoreductase RutF